MTLRGVACCRRLMVIDEEKRKERAQTEQNWENVRRYDQRRGNKTEKK